MIGLAVSDARIFVRPGATDLRKQINGLAVIVEQQMELAGKARLVRVEQDPAAAFAEYQGVPGLQRDEEPPPAGVRLSDDPARRQRGELLMGSVVPDELVRGVP